MRRRGRLWMGSGCFRHKTCIRSNPVWLPLAGGRAGVRRFIFLREEEGLERALVPIAANCSKNPEVTNAAAGTFRQERREAAVRCGLHGGPHCGQSGHCSNRPPLCNAWYLRLGFRPQRQSVSSALTLLGFLNEPSAFPT